jgi:hypothetical protein
MVGETKDLEKVIGEISMYKLVLYKLRASGRWRWRYVVNQLTIARADYHYESPSAARRAFRNFVKGTTSNYPDNCNEEIEK